MLTQRYQHLRSALQGEHPSLGYQQKSDVLWEQWHAGEIDLRQYRELLEALKEEEINNEGYRGPSGSGEVTQGSKDRIAHNLGQFEYFAQETREKEARVSAEEKRKQALTPLERYKEEIPETLARYRNGANSYRRTANFFQMIIIAGSVLATSVTSALGFGLGDAFRWIAPVISIVVAISAGVTAYFKFKERSFNLQQTADAIEQEYVAVDLGIGYYKGKQPQEALELFAERVEFLKDEQKKREQQLEQPPDMKHGQSHM